MTTQIPETLILDGEEYFINATLNIPKQHPRIADIDPNVLNIDINSGENTIIVLSTACWRRYVGTWEIKDGRLY